MDDIENTGGMEYDGDIESLVDMILLEECCGCENAGMDRTKIKEQIEQDINLLGGVLSEADKAKLCRAENPAKQAEKNPVNLPRQLKRCRIECVRKRIIVIEYLESRCFT
ncbi:MAG: hypothetical protein JW724_00735 [Candidatus Altiarchaeota archaeon]|nr:hypothetical protein [Candidatus Altiarchaeota archaeon]